MNTLFAAFDIGSTTIKCLVTDRSGTTLFRDYRRHRSAQREELRVLLHQLASRFPDRDLACVCTGSGGKVVADSLGLAFQQEVICTSHAVADHCATPGTVIEIGGQDAKLIAYEFEGGRFVRNSLRMNTSCAGGTGAFIDEIASLLGVGPEGFNALAARGTTIHDISGRCGVFAKTDIQPLLNNGVPPADIALSTCQAIVCQIISGLGKGNTLRTPLVLLGGPIAFNPVLAETFRTWLGLEPAEVLVPGDPEYAVVRGALAWLRRSQAHPAVHRPDQLCRLLDQPGPRVAASARPAFFASEAERQRFFQRHQPGPALAEPASGQVHLGIDAGSTTVKLLLLGPDCRPVWQFYRHAAGRPVEVLREGLLAARQWFADRGLDLTVLSAGCTGYGEQLVKKAFGLDFGTVETICHFEATRHRHPDASFILDLGGQDMKAIFVDQGTITDITLNEACSAGCGSFLESCAQSLGVAPADFARHAFQSASPASLGSRCTVFMKSSIITEQRAGKTREDILAGLAFAIVQNLFSRILRGIPRERLGQRIVVQGGTFLNDAVLRALELHTGLEVHRADYPALMGAYGAALLARQHVLGRQAGQSATPGTDRTGTGTSGFLSWDQLAGLELRQTDGQTCRACSNHCQLHTVHFSHGASHTTGNRCDRGSRDSQPGRSVPVFNAFQHRQQLLAACGSPAKPASPAARGPAVPAEAPSPGAGLDPGTAATGPVRRIGLPMVFDFWQSLPYWTAVFQALGLETEVSRSLDRSLAKSDPTIASDTICFPAKVVHAHVRHLVARGCSHLFFPLMHKTEAPVAGTRAWHNCAVIQGYPLVVRYNMAEVLGDCQLLSPQFHFFTPEARHNQTVRFLVETLGAGPREARQAVAAGQAAQAAFQASLRGAFSRLNPERRTVLLAGRPYHQDRLVNHDIPLMIASLGFNVLSLDNLPDLETMDTGLVRAETDLAWHDLIYRGALYCARHQDMEMVQITSFGCGHDAVITDEVARILRQSGKRLLVLKVDETASRNTLLIRLRSFLQTLAPPRPLAPSRGPRPAYSRADRQLRTILVPNMAVSYATLSAAVFRRCGYRAMPLPPGSPKALETGKRYTNNDVCFPVQLIIGEVIEFMQQAIDGGSRRDPADYVFAVPKLKGDCRLANYAVACRKALDDAGLADLPLITTTSQDPKSHQPGFLFEPAFQVRLLWATAVHDVIEAVWRAARCRELVPGQAGEIFHYHVDALAAAFGRGIGAVKQALRSCLADFEALPVDDRPREAIFINGEVMLSRHVGGNRGLEAFLEAQGYQTVLSPMIPLLHKDFVERQRQRRQFNLPGGLLDGAMDRLSDRLISHIVGQVAAIARGSRHWHGQEGYRDLAAANPLFDSSYTAGEGCLIPGEIILHARQGIRKFITVQPFGCMPNHITGRGLEKALYRLFPDIRILSLDYDPDISPANLENRLLMFLQAGQLHQPQYSQETPRLK